MVYYVEVAGSLNFLSVALSMIVHRDAAYNKGQKLVSKMKDVIPRQMSAVPI